MAQPHLCPPELLDLDLTGKVAIVTGANSGIGAVTAKQLASQGARVVLACRRVEEGNKVCEEITSAHPGAQAVARRLDLGDLASVRSFAKEFLDEHSELHFLINNAGVMNTSEGRTKDGFELQFGINHLGHFLLTELLTPLLRESAPSRVVCLSSCFHDKAQGREGDIHFDDLFFERTKYDGWAAYAQSKLANLLHAKELARRLEGTGVTVASVHPGWVRTNLVRNTVPTWVQDYLLRPVMNLAGMIEPWEGAQSTLFAALSPSVEEHSGEYYSQLGIYRDKRFNAGGWPMESPNPAAHDDAKAKRLWEVSEQLVGLRHDAVAAE